MHFSIISPIGNAFRWARWRRDGDSDPWWNRLCPVIRLHWARIFFSIILPQGFGIRRIQTCKYQYGISALLPCTSLLVPDRSHIAICKRFKKKLAKIATLKFLSVVKKTEIKKTQSASWQYDTTSHKTTTIPNSQSPSSLSPATHSPPRPYTHHSSPKTTTPSRPHSS